MKYVKYIIQVALGLILAVGIMSYRGLGSAQNMADKVMIISDGFSVAALLFVSFGVLTWISTTGFFDMLSYACRIGFDALIPGRSRNEVSSFYDYKMEKEEKRDGKGDKSLLLVGLVFLIISFVLTAVWYQC